MLPYQANVVSTFQHAAPDTHCHSEPVEESVVQNGTASSAPTADS